MMLKQIRQFFTGVTYQDMQDKVQFKPFTDNKLVEEMTVEYAYRMGVTLQQVIDIQKND